MQGRYPGGYGPPPYGPLPPQMRRTMPAAQPDSFHPARVAVGLLHQSSSRYTDQRASIGKLDRAMSDFELGMGQLLQRSSPQDPARAILGQGYQAITTRAQTIRDLYERLCAEELRLEADIKRLVAGQPPSAASGVYGQQSLASPQAPQQAPGAASASAPQQAQQPQQHVPPEAAALFQQAQQPQPQPAAQAYPPPPPGVQVIPPATYGGGAVSSAPVYQAIPAQQPPLQPIAQQPPPAAHPAQAQTPEAAAAVAVIGAIRGTAPQNGAPPKTAS